MADTFGGISAPQDVVAAVDEVASRDRVEEVVRVVYGPVLDVHWVTVKQLAVLEPTLVETVACMVATLLKDGNPDGSANEGPQKPPSRSAAAIWSWNRLCTQCRSPSKSTSAQRPETGPSRSCLGIVPTSPRGFAPPDHLVLSST
jgi:Phosphogluconate dehydrogenase (decarboxylating) C-term